MIMKYESWNDEGHQSWRWCEAFALIPTKTFDKGYLWLRKYWRYQCSSGWGFWDDFPYVDKSNKA